MLLGKFNRPVVALDRAGRAADRDAEHQCRRERRFAVQRFFEPQPAANFVSNRRTDHRRHRRAADAVETARRFQRRIFSDGWSDIRDCSGPIAGIMIADYFVLRKCTARRGRAVSQRGRCIPIRSGVNWRAVAALAARNRWSRSCGLVFPPLRWLYDYAWFVGFFVAGGAYLALSK